MQVSRERSFGISEDRWEGERDAIFVLERGGDFGGHGFVKKGRLVVGEKGGAHSRFLTPLTSEPKLSSQLKSSSVQDLRAIKALLNLIPS